MNTAAGFLRNTWYMIAWSDEVGERPFSRTLLDTAVVLFRDAAAGRLVALRDRCPHRFAPLSRGQVVDGRLECPYHGLQFDASGRCVANPVTGATPAAARVTAYPVHEVDGTVWLWPGDPALADVARVPRIAHHQAGAGQRWVKGLTTAKADYRLLSDNLMDLSHTYVLHPGLGGRDYKPKVRTWEDADGGIVAEFVVSPMPNFFGEAVIPSPQVRHCDSIRWTAPSVHVLESRTGLVDSEEAHVYIPSAHILTPATAHTTHYFWSSAVPEGFDEQMMRDTLVQAFDHEDKPMVEAVQRVMGEADLWDLDPVLLVSDAGGVRMRRKLAALIAAEQAAGAT